MSTPKVIRWGILATGGIAQTFSKDLLLDPNTRGVTSIKHTIVAAASSSGKERAVQFLKEVGAPSTARAYGSYEELMKDPEIDVVYVSTPHSHHYQNTMLCLEAGKNALVEKAFTVNAAQAKKLAEKAKEKNLFLMEAVWTRYFPLSYYVRDIITSGKLGNIQLVSSDNSISLDPEETMADGKHRMVNPDLAGGALLDCGIYALTWLFQTVYTTLPPAERKAPSVTSALKIYEPTGAADELSSMLLVFPRPGNKDVHAIATTSIRYSSDPLGDLSGGPACRVHGDKGEIQIFPPLYRPTKTRLILRDGIVEDKEWPQPGPGKGSGWFNGFGDGIQPEGEGQGMFWEADEVAYALIDGRKESPLLSWEESVVIMEVMDEVRKQGGLRFPEKIETTDFPVAL
ncbi:oxidoreductase domain-containing protein [Fomitopsis serialis]|uniref:oxidoreductase domain-containing protein n=1 Tax=Fomitopsis serialis TaxID=139415 RepID=UPI00200767B6|nr:oxidoreductase domain-containing protein [Neoantrodia serialis]KAH9914970.1 oxidoreductase domain-containing protein [Neoantrodia serialis]